MLLSDYITQVRSLVHDLASVDWTDAELTNYINNARTAVGLDMQCVRRFVQGVSLIAQQEQYDISAGVLCGVNVTSGGSGYTSAPTVAFTGGTGSGAAGTAVLDGDAVTSVSMTNWGSYTVVPTGVTFTGGGGTGAAGTPITMSNVLNLISVSNLWGNERYMLRYRSFTMFQAYFRPNLNYFQRPCIWTLHQQEMLTFIQPIPDQAYVSEWDIVILPDPLVNTTDIDTQVKMPWADAVQYWAAYLALNKMQNFDQAKYYLTLYERRVPRVIIGAGGIRVPNPYCNAWQRRAART